MIKFVKDKCRIGICEQKPLYFYCFFALTLLLESNFLDMERENKRGAYCKCKAKAAVVTIGIEEQSYN